MHGKQSTSRGDDHPHERAGSREEDAGDAVAIRVIERLLRQGALVRALEYLNRRTRFRFTGLYRLGPPQLHNVALFDRENPDLNVSGAICDLRQTYCSITGARDAPFAVTDATTDALLVAHPARLDVQSYGGAPVRAPDGRVLGTLCHFDGRPRLLASGELQLLEQVAPLFAAWATCRSPEPADLS